MSYPKISIITPSYNQAEFIEDTIKSVVNQQYPNLEYLIFDGGSSDGSVDIIKSYAQKYPRIIHWQSKTDEGQVDALNQAIKKSTGSIIAYLNSDDYYLPGSLDFVAKYFIENPKTQWLIGNCQVNNYNLAWTFTIKHLIPIQHLPKLLYFFNWINQPAVFLSRTLVNKVGYFDPVYHFAFDYDYWLRCLNFASPTRVHQNLATFRIHSNSKGSKNYHQQFIESNTIARKYSTNPAINLVRKLNQKITLIFYHFLK